MSPASRSKSKDKKVGPVGKEPPKASPKPAGSTNPGNAYDPHLGTFHALEPTAVTSAPTLQSNGRFRSIDETDDNCGSSLGTGGEYDAASNNGSWSGESEDHKEKASNQPVRQEAIPGADNDKREKIRQKNERKHQRQKERRAQELHERCSGYLMSRKLEALAQQLVAMGFSSERATMALILNEGRVEESVSWLFEGGEEADKHGSEKLNGENNLKIDITEELAQITGLEMKYKCLKQEVERAIVASEGDIAKAEETLRAQRQDRPSTPPNSEETDDPPTISNGKLPASIISQNLNSLRPSTKSSSSSTIPQRRDEKDFNYTKSPSTVGVPSEPGSKTVQPLKGIQPRLDWARQQQLLMQEDKRFLTAAGSNSSHPYSMASQLQMSQLAAAKSEVARYAALGNESNNLQPGPVREPVIVMQRPQSINLKPAPSTSMHSSSPPGTTAGWYHNNLEIPKSNGGLSPNIPSTRSLNLNNLYHQQHHHHYQHQQYHYQQQHQQFMPMPSSSPAESTGGGAHRGNGLRSRMSTSPTLAAASSLGLFSGLGSTVSSGSSSPVDWSSSSGQMQMLDYTNIDWTLDRNLSNGRSSGGLWQLQGPSLVNNNNSYIHDSSNAASVGTSNPAMRIVPPPHGNGIPIPELLPGVGMGVGGGGGSATAETSSGSSREWSSPFEESDLFSLSRRFVYSPTL